LPIDIRVARELPFIGLSVLPRPLRCKLRGAGDDLQEVDFAGGFIADTVYMCRAMAAEGAGIALLPDFSVYPDIVSGRLVRVYAGWSSAPMPIHALLAPGKHVSPKVRALIDALMAPADALDRLDTVAAV
jgi:DNA-binding transcriptional LysR family regulator